MKFSKKNRPNPLKQRIVRCNEEICCQKDTISYNVTICWVVVNIEIENQVSEYKTKELAEKACKSFEQHGISKDVHGTPLGFENTWNAANKRMKHPEGDPLLKPPKHRLKHSDKRIVELN